MNLEFRWLAERALADGSMGLVLRHEPGTIGLTFDQGGWVSVDAIVRARASHGKPLARAELDSIVATCDKRRFALSPDGSMIRAKQDSLANLINQHFLLTRTAR